MRKFSIHGRCLHLVHGYILFCSINTQRYTNISSIVFAILELYKRPKGREVMDVPFNFRSSLLFSSQIFISQKKIMNILPQIFLDLSMSVSQIQDYLKEEIVFIQLLYILCKKKKTKQNPAQKDNWFWLQMIIWEVKRNYGILLGKSWTIKIKISN